MGKSHVSRVEIQNVAVTATARVGDGDWRQDVTYDLVLRVPSDAVLDRSFVGCVERDCRAPHRDRLLVQKGTAGWFLVKREQLP